MGRAWTDEGEYANLPQQAAHDLAAAGLLRTEPDASGVLRRHALGLVEHLYQGDCPCEDSPEARDPECVVCRALDAAGLLRTEAVSAESGHRDTAERIAQAIEAAIGDEPILMHVTDWRDAMETSARIAREIGEAER